MSGTPSNQEPVRVSGKRVRVWIAVAVVVALVVILGYLLLVGGVVGD